MQTALDHGGVVIDIIIVVCYLYTGSHSRFIRPICNAEFQQYTTVVCFSANAFKNATSLKNTFDRRSFMRNSQHDCGFFTQVFKGVSK